MHINYDLIGDGYLLVDYASATAKNGQWSNAFFTPTSYESHTSSLTISGNSIVAQRDCLVRVSGMMRYDDNSFSYTGGLRCIRGSSVVVELESKTNAQKQSYFPSYIFNIKKGDSFLLEGYSDNNQLTLHSSKNRSYLLFEVIN